MFPKILIEMSCLNYNQTWKIMEKLNTMFVSISDPSTAWRQQHTGNHLLRCISVHHSFHRKFSIFSFRLIHIPSSDSSESSGWTKYSTWKPSEGQKQPSISWINKQSILIHINPYQSISQSREPPLIYDSPRVNFPRRRQPRGELHWRPLASQRSARRLPQQRRRRRREPCRRRGDVQAIFDAKGGQELRRQPEAILGHMAAEVQDISNM